jgi:threonine dehydrogenase-like Zn-dependent dehydrogenase
MKCRQLRKYGHDSCASPPHFVGGFAEYCYLTPGTCVVQVPDSLPDAVAAPANCALATVIAAWEAAHLAAGERVLILGAGALGLYAAAWAADAGCREILVTDGLEHRLTMARTWTWATHTWRAASSRR